MSLDIGIKAIREKYIYRSNVTYNLAPMYYKCIDKDKGFDKLNGMSCENALPILKKALQDLIDNKEEYEKLNPKNGWGSYEGLLEEIEDLVELCKENKDGIIEVE